MNMSNSGKSAHTLIVSDVHLGSPVSRAKKLEETLREWHFEKLILLGDIFDDLDFSRLAEEHWDLLSYIRELSRPEKGIEVVWIKGNHDELLSRVASSFLGIEVHRERQWEFGGKTHLAIHGHQFDRFLVNNKFLSDIASSFYLFLQKIDMEQQRFSRLIKRMSKRWLRLSEKVAGAAIRYGKRKSADVVFCGHTHLAVEKHPNGVDYYNTGCWTDIPSTFATIDEDGTIALHHVS